MLCLHGFAGDKYSSVIRALAETLADRSLRVAAFDWPGHGSSPADTLPPGLIIQGDLDDVVDPRDSEAFAARNGLRLHVVTGADHRCKKTGNLEEILSVTVPFLLG